MLFRINAAQSCALQITFRLVFDKHFIAGDLDSKNTPPKALETRRRRTQQALPPQGKGNKQSILSKVLADGEKRLCREFGNQVCTHLTVHTVSHCPFLEQNSSCPIVKL